MVDSCDWIYVAEIIEEIPRGGIRKPKPDEPAAAQVVGTDGKVGLLVGLQMPR